MKTLLAACAIGALLTMSACGGDYGYYHGAGAVVENDVYYDGFYGPYADGYWANDGFYYRGGDGHFVRDSGEHFRHGMFNGAHAYHSHARPADDHDRR